MAMMDQSRQEDPTLVVLGEGICLILKFVQTVGILKILACTLRILGMKDIWRLIFQIRIIMFHDMKLGFLMWISQADFVEKRLKELL